MENPHRDPDHLPYGITTVLPAIRQR